MTFGANPYTMPVMDGINDWAIEAVKKLLAQAVALIEIDARAVAGLL